VLFRSDYKNAKKAGLDMFIRSFSRTVPKAFSLYRTPIYRNMETLTRAIKEDHEEVYVVRPRLDDSRLTASRCTNIMTTT